MRLSKKSLLITVASLALFGASAASANCGEGTIEEVHIGAWNQETLMIKIAFDSGKEATNVWPSSASIQNGYIRFALNLSAERMSALQAAAMLAMANGSPVMAYSHNTNAQNQADCSNATQLSVFSTLSSS